MTNQIGSKISSKYASSAHKLCFSTWFLRARKILPTFKRPSGPAGQEAPVWTVFANLSVHKKPATLSRPCPVYIEVSRAQESVKSKHKALPRTLRCELESIYNPRICAMLGQSTKSSWKIQPSCEIQTIHSLQLFNSKLRVEQS